MLKKINKIDIRNIIFITILFVVMILLIINTKYIWGSYMDWVSQHSVIPDYFRTLFYKTNNMFPDFALNLGAGQNIYNYAYYGFLNPIVIISYLFPFISMKVYIMISTIILMYTSVLLFYYFIRKNKFDDRVALISTILFIFASPLLYHSHRHIMFVNYMPFLILSLIAVDKYFRYNNKWFLSLNVFIIILMSYYYSISSILCIVIYGVYKYIGMNKKITIKKFFYDGIKFIIPILVGILMSGILLLPVFSSIINGRMPSVVTVKLLELIIPRIHILYMCYDSYGLGLTSIVIISMSYLLLKKEKSNRFLSIILVTIMLLPVINYILNGFMYLDSKVLIPFLPLYVLCISIFLKDLYESIINRKSLIILFTVIIILLLLLGVYKNTKIEPTMYLYFYLEIIVTMSIILLSSKYNKLIIFDIYTIVLVLFVSYFINTSDMLITKNEISYSNDKVVNELVNSITSNDRNMYRITTLLDKNASSNKIFSNINMYQNYQYSSIYNINYNKFFFDVFNNPMQSRNRLLTTSNSNVLFLMFMSNKYLIGRNSNLFGYYNHDKEENISSYVNSDVLPFMYVSYNTLNINVFDKISFPYTNEVLLNYTINNSDNTKYNTNIKKFSVNKYKTNIDINKKMDLYEFNASESSTIEMDLPNEARNKIIFIKFKMNRNQSCTVGDQTITINNEVNKLTCREWKYYNANDVFTYTISEKNIEKLLVKFSEGFYSIKDIELYYLDYNDIKNVNKNVTEVTIDKDLSDNENIYASVNAKENGVFVTSIPYDKGFSIYIDNVKQNYMNINKGFVGFDITKGKHSIIIRYDAPYKTVGVIVSIIGIIVFISFFKRKDY